MAIDFEKIAGAAKEAHEKKLAEQEAALQLERQSHAEKAERCISFLNEHTLHVKDL